MKQNLVSEKPHKNERCFLSSRGNVDCSDSCDETGTLNSTQQTKQKSLRVVPWPHPRGGLNLAFQDFFPPSLWSQVSSPSCISLGMRNAMNAEVLSSKQVTNATPETLPQILGARAGPPLLQEPLG